MHFTLNHTYTDNGNLMLSDDVIREVTAGIDNPSDAIIPAESSLYRIASKTRFDRASNRSVSNAPEAGLMSPWWATDYHFNSAIWAIDTPDMPGAGRAAFAIHPAWRSDCANYASIVTRTDLSVWYGMGNIVTADDPETGKSLSVHPSANVLQIYIPGFRTNFARWSMHARVIAFEAAVSNGRGFQGNMPLGLRPGSV